MSKYFTDRLSALTPYTPGEQPKDQKYVKLNTNESPFPPSPSVIEAAEDSAGRLQLYCDPECKRLTEKAADVVVGGIGVLNAIVEQGAQDRILVQTHFRNDLRNGQGMDDIGGAILPLLGRMLFVRIKHSFFDEAQIRIGHMLMQRH